MLQDFLTLTASICCGHFSRAGIATPLLGFRFGGANIQTWDIAEAVDAHESTSSPWPNQEVGSAVSMVG